MATDRKHASTLKAIAKFEPLVREALKDPVVDKFGYLIQYATLSKHGIDPTSWISRSLLKSMAEEMGVRIKVTDAPKAGSRVGSMPFGPETLKMEFSDTQHPAIYAIICKGSGRMYIGVSKRPDLRRAVHYYWLKHIYTKGQSNIFHNKKQLIADLEKYGLDSFYMELVELLPHGLTRGEMIRAELDYMARIDRSKLYNEHVDGTYAKRVIRKKNPAYVQATCLWRDKIEQIKLELAKEERDWVRIKQLQAEARAARAAKRQLPPILRISLK